MVIQKDRIDVVLDELAALRDRVAILEAQSGSGRQEKIKALKSWAAGPSSGKRLPAREEIVNSPHLVAAVNRWLRMLPFDVPEIAFTVEEGTTHRIPMYTLGDEESCKYALLSCLDSIQKCPKVDTFTLTSLWLLISCLFAAICGGYRGYWDNHGILALMLDEVEV